MRGLKWRADDDTAMTRERHAVASALEVRATRLTEAACAVYGPAPGTESIPGLDTIVVEPPPDQFRGEPTFPNNVGGQTDVLAGVTGVVVRREDGRVLCVLPAYSEGWSLPAGTQNTPESLADTARRVTYDETGVGIELTGVLYTRMLAVDYGVDERAVVPMVVFTAVPTADRPVVSRRFVSGNQPDVADVQWFRPADLPDSVEEAERVRAFVTGGVDDRE